MEVASSLSLTPGMRRGPGIALYEVKLKDPHSILAHPSRGGAAKPGASKGKLPDEVVRLPKVSRATVAGAIQAIDRPVCQRPLPGIYAERPNPDFSEMPFAFPTDRDVAGGGPDVQLHQQPFDECIRRFGGAAARVRRERRPSRGSDVLASRIGPTLCRGIGAPERELDALPLPTPGVKARVAASAGAGSLGRDKKARQAYLPSFLVFAYASGCAIIKPQRTQRTNT